jgi:hypothetical protein
MPIASAADVYENAARQLIRLNKGPLTTQLGLTSFWAAGGNPAAGTLAVGNTTSGVLFTDATAGAPPIRNFGAGNTGHLSAARAHGSGVGLMTTLYDRIWGAGAVSLTTLGTTNFSGQPSIAGRLPGGNDFGSVEIWIELTTTVSATATTVSVGYTNEAGTSGRTTGATASLSGTNTPRIIVMPLQAGDKGVQRIDSVTVGGTVATAGAFNVLLVRRIAEFALRGLGGLGQSAYEASLQTWETLGGPVVFDTSCLACAVQFNGTTSSTVNINLTIVDG